MYLNPLLAHPAHKRPAVIESITNYREAQPTMEAIYLLMPTSQNVDRIIRDFSNGKQQYAAAHLFFIDGMHMSLDYALCDVTA